MSCAVWDIWCYRGLVGGDVFSRYGPVTEDLDCAIRCGGPSAMMFPPCSPPLGPMSMIQSAHAMRSGLCSMMMMVFPLFRSAMSVFASSSMSEKCSPVVGSSRM